MTIRRDANGGEDADSMQGEDGKWELGVGVNLMGEIKKERFSRHKWRQGGG